MVSKGWATRLPGTHWTDGMAGARMSRCRWWRAGRAGNWKGKQILRTTFAALHPIRPDRLMAGKKGQ
jgi:hypothetical protein